MKRASNTQRLQQRIQRIKTRLAALGDMRPGSLSRQYNVCGKAGCRCKDRRHPQRHGPYYQLSYVHRGKSTTRFIRRPCLPMVRAQLAAYKQFRRLTEEWVAVALKIAAHKLKAAVQAAKNRAK